MSSNNNNLSSSLVSNPLLDSISTATNSTDSISVGNISTTTYTYPYDNFNGMYSGVRISDDYMEKKLLQKKVEEILESVQDYCKNFCFQGCEGICDGETKSQCLLWNRLKCEKKV